MNPHDPDTRDEPDAPDDVVDAYREWVTFSAPHEWPAWVHRMRQGIPLSQPLFLLPGMDHDAVLAEARDHAEQHDRETQRMLAEARERWGRKEAEPQTEDDWEYYERTGRYRA